MFDSLDEDLWEDDVYLGPGPPLDGCDGCEDEDEDEVAAMARNRGPQPLELGRPSLAAVMPMELDIGATS